MTRIGKIIPIGKYLFKVNKNTRITYRDVFAVSLLLALNKNFAFRIMFPKMINVASTQYIKNSVQSSSNLLHYEAICVALRDLVPLAQFKKREKKTPMEEC